MESQRERLRSAFFLDFDNVFGGLFEIDRHAAFALATEPNKWINTLTTRPLPFGARRRDFLVRRAYLNPAGYVADRMAGNDQGRLYFQKFRPKMTQAGFEVVDCPTLTSRHKNAADIRMTIDVLGYLDGYTHYDEFVVASSDADFTPLLQFLRAHDRRITIVSSGPTAPAYRNIADVYIDAYDLVRLLTDKEPSDSDTDSQPVASSGTEEWKRDQHRVRILAGEIIERATEPVRLADLGQVLRSEFGDAIDSTDWFGCGSLSGFIKSMPGVQWEGHYAWDSNKHSAPTNTTALPGSISEICQITELPRIGAEAWKAVFDKLSLYSSTHEFNLTECTSWTRDRLAEDGMRVGRNPIEYIVHGALLGGVRWDARLAPSADDIREALIVTTLDRFDASGSNLTEENRVTLKKWLQGKKEGD